MPEIIVSFVDHLYLQICKKGSGNCTESRHYYTRCILKEGMRVIVATISMRHAYLKNYILYLRKIVQER